MSDAPLENSEHLEEDQNNQHNDDSPNDTDVTHIYSCIYCATGLHGQCRGDERYRGNLIRCECDVAGHPMVVEPT